MNNPVISSHSLSGNLLQPYKLCTTFAVFILSFDTKNQIITK